MKIAGPPHYDQATEREAMLDGIRWVLDLVTTNGSLRTKLLALRYLLQHDGSSLKELGAPFGTSKQAIDRWDKDLLRGLHNATHTRGCPRKLLSTRQADMGTQAREHAMSTQQAGGYPLRKAPVSDESKKHGRKGG